MATSDGLLTCPDCGGNGMVPTVLLAFDTCKRCNGTGFLRVPWNKPTWTKTRPTTPGWYWIRFIGPYMYDDVARVDDDGEFWVIGSDIKNGWKGDDSYDGCYWQGPIAPDGEPPREEA